MLNAVAGHEQGSGESQGRNLSDAFEALQVVRERGRRWPWRVGSRKATARLVSGRRREREIRRGDPDEAVRRLQGLAERARRAVLRLQAVECRLAFGEIGAAIAAVEAAGHVAAGLPAPLATCVEGVRREVDVDVTERLAAFES